MVLEGCTVVMAIMHLEKWWKVKILNSKLNIKYCSDIFCESDIIQLKVEFAILFPKNSGKMLKRNTVR